ncbi:ABC transporter ATP-binding protein [Clostridium phoceensis]|uniref:betaine/proline/choline family ABC transporter ATP-binding protein n=1 Tax=Clostridium phoceensis TaxID=1650661 RepID=UPI00067F6A43|nr:ABC transporter ATP-binding protein [Clostridium phoceensis]
MIEFQNVSMAYKDRPVLNHVDLTIQDSEFFVLIGSSGCGKTTLLKSINKLLNVQKGKLLINGTPVDRIKTNQLPNLVGYVVQAGGLFPHLTVEENITLVMRIAGYPSERISERVTEMLRMVDLDPDTYRNQYPSQLSGGQQQRVGVARAFAVDPPIVLMDEPFSALDPMTRAELQDEIHTLQKKTKKTVVFVTHDMDEAIKLADRICIIQEGHIVQCDTPERILKAPANQYVTDFIGANRLWANPEYIRARDIMRRRPITISRGRTVLQALQIMRQSGVDSLLVVDGRDRLLGVLWLEELMSEKDGSGSAETYLSDDYVAVEGDTTLKEIISTIDYDVSGIIPVIEHDRTLVGFLTKSSLLATMSRQFVPEHTAGERSGVIWAAAAH